MVRLLGLMLAATMWSGLAQAQTAPVQRGDYLVNTILACGNCHTPRGPKGVFDMERQLSGGPQTWDTATYRVKGSNITPDPETGIGKWTDAQIKTAIQQGIRPDGTPLAPIMPHAFYKVFVPADLDAVVAYMKSVKPIRNAVEAPVYKAAMHVEVLAGAEKAMSAADMNDPVKRGFYLVTVGHCMECHTPELQGGHDFRNSLGRGGQEFKGPWGLSISRNITSHKDKGLGGWTDDQIKAAITKGVSKDGSALKPPMGYPLYARMTDQDLNAVVAYLRTVPPKE